MHMVWYAPHATFCTLTSCGKGTGMGWKAGCNEPQIKLGSLTTLAQMNGNGLCESRYPADRARSIPKHTPRLEQCKYCNRSLLPLVEPTSFVTECTTSLNNMQP